MKPSYLILLLCLGCIGLAQAEIYKSVDSEGHVTYSSSPTKGAKKLDLEPPLPSSPPPARARNNTRSSPSDFPRVDSETQKNRDSARRRILAEELATEEKLLAEARRNLKSGEDEKTADDTAKYHEKMKSLREQVSLHEKNIGALKTELSNHK